MFQEQLDIRDSPDAVPCARRFAVAALAELPMDVVDAAALVVTELATNAVLHGSAPYRLVVSSQPDGHPDGRARIEVHDGSRAVPVRPLAGGDGMTGRGLALVDAVAADWGVVATDDGKYVWVELTAKSVELSEPGDVDLDALLAGFEDWPEAAERFTVTLGDVPTGLLLDAKAHVDSVVRELTLSESGSRSGVSGTLPPHLAELVHDVVTEFAEARQAIKRQAITAFERGQARTTLVLTLPAEAAEAGERYLTALGEADTYARASRLLTLAAPPQHRAFRRWYVTALVDGLRRATAGDGTVTAPSFESFLMTEVGHLAELQQVSDRAARLQRVSSALAAALDSEQVAETALVEAAAELGALRGAVLLPAPDLPLFGTQVGYTRELWAQLAAAWAAGVPMPGLTAYRTGQPVWLETREQRDEQYPGYGQYEPDIVAACAVPMHVAGHTVGVMRLSFAEARLFTEDERSFLEALAAVAAQALERASLFETKTLVADRLTRLQAVTAALAATRTVDEVLDVTIEHATGLVGARIASLSLVGEDGRSIEIARVQPPLADGAEQWRTFGLDDPLPVAEAIRTGLLIWVDSVAERDARWPALAQFDSGHDHSLVVLPLHVEDSTRGALTLSFPVGEGQDLHAAPAHDFFMAFADACAQALQRAWAAEREAEANRKLSFLAQASAELAGTLDVEATLSRVVRLAVPVLADWCVLHLVDEGELVPLAVAHVDPDKTALARATEERWPARLADPSGVGPVVRSGAPVLVPSIPRLRAQLQAAGEPARSRGAEHDAIMEKLGLVSVIIVPLTARGRTFGALTFITAESGRIYGDSDLEFARDLASRAAVALDNARLFQEATNRSLEGGFPHEPTGEGRPDTGGRGTLTNALSAAEVAQFVLHLDDQRLDADWRLAAFFGLGPDDEATHLEDFQKRIHPEDAPRVSAAIADAVARRGEYVEEHRVVLSSGGTRWIAVRGAVLTNAAGEPDRLAGVAYDTTRAREGREQLARLLETMNDGFFRLDPAMRFTYANGQAERMLFRRRDDLLGRHIWDEFPRGIGTGFRDSFDRAVAGGRQVTFEDYMPSLDAWFEIRAIPDAEGLSVFFHDVSARRQAEHAREAAHARLELLAEATRGMVGASDELSVLARVTDVLVPRLADWVVLGTVDEAGQISSPNGVHRDPALTAAIAELVRDRPETFAGVERVARVARTGRAELVTSVDLSVLVGSGPRNLLGRLGAASALVVPVQAGDRTLGVAALVRGPDRPVFDVEDLATAHDIGRRAGLALENARLYMRQRREAEVLQRSLLTPLPETPGLLLTARYRAAAEQAQVGGDWYDAFLQPDGQTVLVIGDVIGHDISAAAAMGQLRSLLRGTAFDRKDSPARVLARVDGAVRGLAVDTLATALVARLESAGQDERGPRTLRWSNAGHPPAMLLGPDGRVTLLDQGQDLLLGLDPETARHDHTVELPPGSTLLLYTDGLVERRDDSALGVGLARLRDALTELGALPLDELCDAILDRLLPDAPDDDVALLAVRTRSTPA
ncbi:MAG: putative sensor protein [Frankiales bacterium]|nr:putative sensor protein [Frankiales bacterium]